MFSIQYAKGVGNDLAGVRAFDRRQIYDRIEDQLTHQPTSESRNKKILIGLIPPWVHVAPTWELRIGEFRVFYDVNETDCRVTVRAIRQKPLHRTTEEIL